MKKVKFTKEQRVKYYQELRSKWMMNKLKADGDDKASQTYKKLGLKVSFYGFYWTMMQMEEQHLDGLPYIDAKTYKGWLETGFKVKKGEKSTLSGIVWREIKAKDADEDDEPLYLLPKVYSLFHKSQVEKR